MRQSCVFHTRENYRIRSCDGKQMRASVLCHPQVQQLCSELSFRVVGPHTGSKAAIDMPRSSQQQRGKVVSLGEELIAKKKGWAKGNRRCPEQPAAQTSVNPAACRAR
jgi:hypothetical protein